VRYLTGVDLEFIEEGANLRYDLFGGAFQHVREVWGMPPRKIFTAVCT